MPTAAHDVLRVRCVLQCTRTSGTNCFIYARMSLIRNATLPTSLTPQDARDAVACLTELGGPSHVCPAETTSQCGRQSFRLSWMCGSPGTHAPPRPARTTGPTAGITVQFADLHLFGSVSVFDIWAQATVGACVVCVCCSPHTHKRMHVRARVVSMRTKCSAVLFALTAAVCRQRANFAVSRARAMRVLLWVSPCILA